MPLLFLLFFCVLQVLYTAFAALAVQRTSYALARESSLTGKVSGTVFMVRLYAAMGPLAFLSRTSLVSVAATTFECRPSTDGAEMRVLVRYPMPIWVPLAGKVFGEKMGPEVGPSKDLFGVWERLERAGLRFPDPWREEGRLPYFRWMNFEAVVHNEGKI